MRQWLFFDGKNSKDYGVYISGRGTFGAPARDQESISVAGRNGDLTLDNGRYKNIIVTYPAFIYRDFKNQIAAFRNHLFSGTSYRRLEDTYHPNEYRLAKYTGSFDPDVVADLRAGEFELTFDCYPQRFLKSGEKTITFTSGGSIRNDWSTVALPLVRAYGNGSVTINGITITISGADGYTDIDCDIQEAYKDTPATSRNSNITLSNGVFFSLTPGINTISFTCSRVEITPRWWIL